MEDKRYLDDEGLALYDEEIKRYIRRRIDFESAELQQDMEIREWFPEIEEVQD